MIATIDKLREHHDALNYMDKQIILIGGLSYGMAYGVLGKLNYHNSVYRINLSDGKVSELPSLNKGRAYSASCEQRGIIYVAGGLYSRKSYTNTIEVLNLPRGSTKWVIFALENLTPRRAPMMASLHNGKILIAGGLDSIFELKNDVLIMNTNRQDTTGEVVTRSKFGFVCINSSTTVEPGHILAIGQITSSSRP